MNKILNQSKQNEEEIEMSESLTANAVTPYSQAGTPTNSDEDFVNNPAPDDVPGDGYSTSYDEEEEEDLDLSLSELMYSVSSFYAIMQPVTITMTLAALAAVYCNDEATMEFGEEQFAEAYNVWKIDNTGGGASSTKQLAASIVNTFVMICFIAAMTFGIVFLYKYRCMKLLIGYMVFSSASLLGFLGDYMGTVAIEIYRIPIDKITWFLFMYNFAIVGVTAIFYQKGIPPKITQVYLVCTSVILAWHLSHFDDWTAWTLLVMLAFYDLCAVLSPCGPLKALVNLMSEKDSPEMPGLLYEAHLPQGTSRSNTRHQNSRSSIDGRGNESSDDEDLSSEESDNDDNVSYDESRTNDTSTSNQGQSTSVLAARDTTPLTNGRRAFIPLALAKVYRLPLLNSYGIRSTTPRRRNTETEGINESPLLADEMTPEEFYQRSFTRRELLEQVEVQFPQNGGWIEKVDEDDGRSNKGKYNIFGKNGEIRRVLVISKQGKVYEVNEDGEDDDESEYEERNSIRLGLVSSLSSTINLQASSYSNKKVNP